MLWNSPLWGSWDLSNSLVWRCVLLWCGSYLVRSSSGFSRSDFWPSHSFQMGLHSLGGAAMQNRHFALIIFQMSLNRLGGVTMSWQSCSEDAEPDLCSAQLSPSFCFCFPTATCCWYELCCPCAGCWCELCCPCSGCWCELCCPCAGNPTLWGGAFSWCGQVWRGKDYFFVGARGKNQTSLCHLVSLVGFCGRFWRLCVHWEGGKVVPMYIDLFPLSSAIV